MRTRSFAVITLLAIGGSGAAFGQQPARGTGTPPARKSILGRFSGPSGAVPPAPPRTGTPTAAPVDAQVFKSGDVIPEPTSLDEIGQATIPLPTEPIEPYLLTKHNGPFMVLAHTFRGPQAVRYAQALAKELRGMGMPAYIFFLRIQPGHANIRGVPPTAIDAVQGGENVVEPEKYRMYDEAAVLVGDCKSIDESEKVLYQVKHTRSVVLDGVPSIWKWRRSKGLGRAMLTTNPLVAAEDLYPADADGQHLPTQVAHGQAVDPAVLTASLIQEKKEDPLVQRMNSGPRSVLKCPGPYSLQVAEFVGRSTFDTNKDQHLFTPGFLKQGPLAKAADDAEGLANALAKCASLDKRFQPYVYHDRTSSKVFLGSFQGPNDPALGLLRGQLDKVSNELVMKRYTMLPLAPSQQVSAVPRP